MVFPFVLQFSCRLPVSVCGTGTSISTLAAFLASVNSSASLLVFTPHHRLASDTRTSLRASLTIWPRFSIPVVRLSFCVPASNYCGGTGISTSCPSSTPFGLNLGPDLPWVDEPSPGNLRLSTEKFLTSLSLLMPAFSLVCSPPPLSIWLLPAYIAPLPIYISIFPSFGDRF